MICNILRRRLYRLPQSSPCHPGRLTEHSQSYPPEYSIATDEFSSFLYSKEEKPQVFSDAKRWYSRYLTDKFRQIWPVVAAVVNRISEASDRPKIDDEIIITKLLLTIAAQFRRNNLAVAWSTQGEESNWLYWGWASSQNHNLVA
jgi:hypothetical protein